MEYKLCVFLSFYWLKFHTVILYSNMIVSLPLGFRYITGGSILNFRYLSQNVIVNCYPL